jgi:hypothetical protein
MILNSKKNTSRKKTKLSPPLRCPAPTTTIPTPPCFPLRFATLTQIADGSMKLLETSFDLCFRSQWECAVAHSRPLLIPASQLQQTTFLTTSLLFLNMSSPTSSAPSSLSTYNSIRFFRVDFESSRFFYNLPDLPNLRHIYFFAPAHHRSSFDNDCVRFFPLHKFAYFLPSIDPKSISFHLYDRSSSLRWRITDKEWREATKGWDRLESVTFSGGWLSCIDREGKDTAPFWPSQSLLRMTYDFRLRPQKGLSSLKELLPEDSIQALREKDSRVVVLVSSIAARDGLLDTLAGREDNEKEKYNGGVRVRAKGSGEDLHRNWEQVSRAFFCSYPSERNM